MLKAFFKEGVIEAGCDEAGRGCLAGPVFAAAVILPQGFFHPLLNDSKKMTEKNRETLRDIIKKEALAFAVATCSAEEIDNINILNASFLAMHRAIDQLKTRPEFLLIDGNRFNPYPNLQHKCIIGGDALYQSISAASVLAKTYRDKYMQSLHNEYPEYNWKKNKGYPTTDHRLAIKKHGLTPHHRHTFAAKFIEPSLFD
ncbi:MAG TPA: ribonuclease HII [Bacteroidales bacterium]|nr:ribonuclease HII [Bacteroidales bacterium]